MKEAFVVGKSARIIGWDEFGLGARDMNALLKKHGYLYGEAGAYGLTEKGKQFGEQHHHDNGYGGYAYRSWETTTWDDNLARALRADVKTNPEGVLAERSVQELPGMEVAEGGECNSGYGASSESECYDLGAKEVAVVAGVLAVGYVGFRFGPPLWRNQIKPAAQKLRSKFGKPTSTG
jgi:hypothetical protein